VHQASDSHSSTRLSPALQQPMAITEEATVQVLHQYYRRLQMCLTRITLLLNRCWPWMCLSMDSRKATVHKPPSVSKEISTTMLSTRHFRSLTCKSAWSFAAAGEHWLSYMWCFICLNLYLSVDDLYVSDFKGGVGVTLLIFKY